MRTEPDRHLLGQSQFLCALHPHTADFRADTLESRIVPGLFAAGEVLDVDGDCGGFNLQWAWSSGYVAGKLGDFG